MMLNVVRTGLWFVLLMLGNCTPPECCSFDLSASDCNVTLEWNCVTVSPSSEQTSQYKCCKSLDSALECASHVCVDGHSQKRLNATIHFNSSSEYLYNSSTFQNNTAQIQLVGSQNGTVVHCSHGAALTFDGSAHTDMPMDVKISFVSFRGCGSVQPYSAALNFTAHCSIELDHISVGGSHVLGLALVNVLETVTVSQSLFLNNTNPFCEGAGVLIAMSLNESNNNNYTNTVIHFVNCTFSSNQALMKHIHSNYTPFSSGGGMLIDISGNTHGVHLQLHNCTFSNNSAVWGSGLMIKLDKNASQNEVIIEKSTFRFNSYTGTDPYIAGGGAMIMTSFVSSSNSVLMDNCSFVQNNATWGGGVEIYSRPLEGKSRKNLNFVTLKRCFFKQNTATNGAALNIYCRPASTSPELCSTLPTIQDSCFISNGQNASTILPSYNQITGFIGSVIAINYFPTKLEGLVHFVNNTGSSLHVHETSVILNNAEVLFCNNTAQNGGAISLYGGWLSISNSSSVTFDSNKAEQRGGAIFVHQTSEDYVPYSHICFIRNTQNSEPREWSSTFHFVNNVAKERGDSIFATSLLPCVWTEQNSKSSLDDDLRAVFCKWKNWTFEGGNCTDQIHTTARNFSDTPSFVEMFPGISYSFISGVDDLGHKISDLAVTPTIWPLSSSHKEHVHYINNSLTVFGRTGTNVNVLLEVEVDRTIFMMVNIALEQCPPGFVFDNKTMSCTCLDNTIHGVLHCSYGSDSNWRAFIITGYCMSYSVVRHAHGHNDTPQVVYGRCPFKPTLYYKQHSVSPYLLLPLHKEDLENKFCGLMNRAGILCGKCMDNYSIDVFSDSFQCHQCKTSGKNWAYFILVEGIIPLIFFLIVIRLHISLTSGPANGFIFFSQIITVALEVIVIRSSWSQTNVHYPNMLTNVMVDFYSIWSLDFSRIFNTFAYYIWNYHICLGNELKVIHVLALRYLSALYPLCLIVVTYILIELHARNCRVLVRLWKPLCFLCVRFRQSWRAKTSIVDAFAVFILLSYVKILRISLILTTFTFVYSNRTEVMKVVNYDPTVPYLSNEHAPFAAVGTFFLLTFGLLPPLLLIFYQFRIVQRYLNACKLNRTGLRIFMDAFQGCYKDGKDGAPDRRFFAGIYFVFRIVIFIIFDMFGNLAVTYILLLSAFIVFSIITMVLQPYKKVAYTYIDIVFFNLLAVIMGLQELGLYVLQTNSHFPLGLMAIIYSLTLVPLVYMISYSCVWLWKHLYHSPYCVSMRNQLRREHRQLSCSSFPVREVDGYVPPQRVTHSEVSTDDGGARHRSHPHYLAEWTLSESI